MWFVLAAMAPVAAAEPSPEARVVLGQLSTKYGPADVLKGSFVQRTASPYGEQVQQGTVVLKRPGKVRWESGPGGRQFVCDGSTLWIYDPAEKQVTRIKGVGEQVASTFAVLQSMDRLGERYDVALSGGDAAAGWDLSLSPKAGDDTVQFKKVVIELDPKLGLDLVKITDLFDVVTTIDFTGLELGGAVGDDVFTFQVPAGVQVVDAGG
ncbi:MAG: outer membrane lipoprotein carrier protein LolA [Myxococcota bacterium]